MTSPTILGKLLKVKEVAGTAKPLLQPDVTQPGRRTIAGVPVLTSPAVAANTLWVIPKPRVVVALRHGVELKVDESAFFTSDRVGIRVVMRLGWGFLHNAAITKITAS